ncbi:MAG: presqualene diphosphate synthase HpnD [Alphaproteobacteria bacterium]
MIGPNTDTDAADRRAVRLLVSRSGSSFLWPMRLLGRERRAALHAVYACCRELDDIADGEDSLAERRTRLAEWAAEIDAAFEGRPHWPVGRALAAAVRRFALAVEDMREVVRGMEMDLEERMRAPSREELALYCRRVAGAVGLLTVAILDCRDADSRAFALALGEAMQITNILRDLEEDAARGRLYLPREFLADAGIDTTDPEDVLRHPAIAEVCARLAEAAHQRYDDAARLLAACDRRRLRLAVMLMLVYRPLLDRLGADGWRFPRRRARPGPVSIARAALASYLPGQPRARG